MYWTTRFVRHGNLLYEKDTFIWIVIQMKQYILLFVASVTTEGIDNTFRNKMMTQEYVGNKRW
jgi:hypothetical protein